ncbi:MAG: helix-turn-helix domain-containing protein [Moheibacter sp.]
MSTKNYSIEDTVNLIKSRGFANTLEASIYLSLSIHYIRRLAREKELPSYKPNGKCIYFKVEDLDNYLLSNNRISNEKIMDKTTKYLFYNQ